MPKTCPCPPVVSSHRGAEVINDTVVLIATGWCKNKNAFFNILTKKEDMLPHIPFQKNDNYDGF